VTEGPYRGSHDRLAEAARRHEMGREQWQRARFADAEKNLTAAHAARTELLGADHPLTIDTLERIAALRHYQLALDTEPLFDTVVDARRKAHGAESVPTAVALRNRGAYRRDSGLPGGASDLDEAVAVLQRLVGDEHPELVAARKAQAYHRVCVAEPESTELHAALALAERAHKCAYRCHGDEHPFTAGALLIVARAELRLGRQRRAHKHIRKTIELFRLGYSNDHPLVAVATAVLGYCELARGDQDAALAAWQRAFDIYARTYPRSPFGAELLVWLAQHHLMTLDVKLAFACVDEIIATARQFPRTRHELCDALILLASSAGARTLWAPMRRLLDLAGEHATPTDEEAAALAELRRAYEDGAAAIPRR
jgi:tetratricopeptide (TPR) repeat protein